MSAFLRADLRQPQLNATNANRLARCISGLHLSGELLGGGQPVRTSLSSRHLLRASLGTCLTH